MIRFRTKSTITKNSFNFEKAFKNGVRMGLQKTSIDLAGKPASTSLGIIKQEMNKPKTGRKYIVNVGRGGRILKRERIHTASNKSGQESSAVLTGALRRSIKGVVIGSNQLQISADTPYARLQEYGGTNSQGRKVDPRNNLERPITQSRRLILNNLDNLIKNNLRIK